MDGEQKGRALPLMSLPSCSSPLNTAQNEAISPFVYLLLWCIGQPNLGTKWSSFSLHEPFKVMLSLRRRNLLFRSIVDQKSNNIYIWRRPQVRSECAIGHFWACIKAKFPHCTPWLYLTNPARLRALVTATDILLESFLVVRGEFCSCFLMLWNQSR